MFISHNFILAVDTVPERLRGWTRNPLGSARRGSNPLGVVCKIVVTPADCIGVADNCCLTSVPQTNVKCHIQYTLLKKRGGTSWAHTPQETSSIQTMDVDLLSEVEL